MGKHFVSLSAFRMIELRAFSQCSKLWPSLGPARLISGMSWHIRPQGLQPTHTAETAIPGWTSCLKVAAPGARTVAHAAAHCSVVGW
jgi:hypothetical protein